MRAAMAQHQPNYSTTCPSCGNERGVVRAAATVVGRPNDITVSLECPSCMHHWQQSFEQLERFGRPQSMRLVHSRGSAVHR
jgi:transposase-like protein